MAIKYKSDLYPPELKQRAIIDQWIDYASQHIATPFSKIMWGLHFYKLAKTMPDSRAVEDSYNLLNKNLPIIESHLNQFAYIAGDNITLADCVMLASMDVAELSKVDLSIYPHIAAWRNKLMRQEFYLKCHDNYSTNFDDILNSIIPQQ